MNIRENVPLASLTTFNVGGSAQFFVEAYSEKEIEAAVKYAQSKNLAIYPLGAGSNVLVPDTGVEGLVLRVCMSDMTLAEEDDSALLTAGAGVAWDEVVAYAAERSLFGIENLAGIPGTVGGAVVQNIGAYGAEFEQVFAYADVYNMRTRTYERIDRARAAFGYRTSFFKEHRELLVVRVAVRLSKRGTLILSYPDLARAKSEGAPLATPKDVAMAVRGIRSRKFPTSAEGGTAGSFFKNPILTQEQLVYVAARFPNVPMFPQKNGNIKIPLAWILDHGLSLKGYSVGSARLYERQPLVIIAGVNARAEDIDALARIVSNRVHDATRIRIEREVETFSERKTFF